MSDVTFGGDEALYSFAPVWRSPEAARPDDAGTLVIFEEFRRRHDLDRDAKVMVTSLRGPPASTRLLSVGTHLPGRTAR